MLVNRGGGVLFWFIITPGGGGGGAVVFRYIRGSFIPLQLVSSLPHVQRKHILVRHARLPWGGGGISEDGVTNISVILSQKSQLQCMVLYSISVTFVLIIDIALI